MNIQDIIVVGLGSHGSACFGHLSTKFKVLGIEQFVSPHSRGTHNGETRLVRDSWYIEPEDQWNCGENCKNQLILQYLLKVEAYFGKLADQYQQASFSPNQEAKNISNEEFQTIFNIDSTGLELNNCKYMKHEYKDGYTLVYTDQDLQMQEIATDSGGLIEIDSELLSIFKTGIVVIFLKCNNKKYQNLPIFLCEQNAKVIYGFSPINNQIKMGIHWFGPELVYPELFDHCQNPDFTINTIRSFLKRFMPGLVDNKVIKTQTCIYANIPDKHFIIDFDPKNRDTIQLSACSGNGFNFSIAM